MNDPSPNEFLFLYVPVAFVCGRVSGNEYYYLRRDGRYFVIVSYNVLIRRSFLYVFIPVTRRRWFYAANGRTNASIGRDELKPSTTAIVIS